MQEQVVAHMRKTGSVTSTSGVTRSLSIPQDIDGMFANIRTELDRSYISEGPRLYDRKALDSTTTYRSRRFEHFSNLEGVREYAYDDHTGARVKGTVSGNTTVGIGFNMDREGARDTWSQVFGDSVSFDDVHSGKLALTRPQVQALFDYDILQFEKVVDKAAGNRVLNENQRTALLSIAYTSPARVAGWADVIQSGDDEKLRNLMLYESYDKSLPVAAGLQTRRYKEAALFSDPVRYDEQIPQFGEYRQFVSGNKVGRDGFKSKHYSWEDFRNERFADAKMDEGLVGLLDNVTDQFGSKLKLTSGFRSQAYNQDVSFSGKAGPHTHGHAADIDVSGYSDEQKSQLVSLLVANGARGLGHYSNGSIHVDLRPTRGKGPEGLALWWNNNQSYTSGKSWFSSGVNQGLSSRNQG
jgi:GH24 family phage-related lysozyme (muramidase)